MQYIQTGSLVAEHHGIQFKVRMETIQHHSLYPLLPDSYSAPKGTHEYAIPTFFYYKITKMPTIHYLSYTEDKGITILKPFSKSKLSLPFKNDSTLIKKKKD